ncbi:type II toxin-antitoxin system PemK/MazF family toxin [Bosea sp. CCNWLW174]|uniref:type II toxin-antitoxin system PemK/MazF family toxin n=1 Tax=unclassified Bosea (in: a-proteobacteria) TaxID=2653178 RepID=UPI00301429B9
MVKRGEIWLAALDPTIGSEIQKTRPCLVISPPEIHDHLRTVIVAPMTSGSRPAGFRVPVQFQGVDGLILLEQSRALDKQRLRRKLGSVADVTLGQVLQTLRELYAD